MGRKKLISDLLNGKSIKIRNSDKIIKICNYNSISGYIYENNKDRLPENLIEEFRKFYYSNYKRNMVLKKELTLISNLLDKKKNKDVLLKGFSVIHLTEESLGSRFISDIDILTINQDYNIIKILKKRGYSEQYNIERKAYLETFHHYPPLVKDIHGTKVIFEVHKQIEQVRSPFKIVLEELEFVDIEDVGLKSLSVEDMIIHLCVECGYDFFNLGLKRIIDIGNLIEKNKNIEWSKIINKSLKWNCQSFVYKVLRLTRDIIELDIPDDKLRILRKNSRIIELTILKINENNLFKTQSKTYFQMKRWIFKILLARGIKDRFMLARHAYLMLRARLRSVPE